MPGFFVYTFDNLRRIVTSTNGSPTVVDAQQLSTNSEFKHFARDWGQESEIVGRIRRLENLLMYTRPKFNGRRRPSIKRAMHFLDKTAAEFEIAVLVSRQTIFAEITSFQKVHRGINRQFFCRWIIVDQTHIHW